MIYMLEVSPLDRETQTVKIRQLFVVKPGGLAANLVPARKMSEFHAQDSSLNPIDTTNHANQCTMIFLNGFILKFFEYRKVSAININSTNCIGK